MGIQGDASPWRVLESRALEVLSAVNTRFLQYLDRPELGIVAGNQPEVNALVDPVDGVTESGAMDMAVVTFPNTVFLQDIQNLPALVYIIDRGIVQESNGRLSKGAPGLHGEPQPAGFAADNLSVAALSFFVDPAPGAAERVTAVFISVVEKDLQRIKPLGGKELLHLGPGAEPVVMVALEKEFPAVERMEKGKISLRFLQCHPPGDIAHNNRRILRRNNPVPVLPKPLRVIVPALENVHGFAPPKGQMRISYGVQAHIPAPFCWNNDTTPAPLSQDPAG